MCISPLWSQTISPIFNGFFILCINYKFDISLNIPLRHLKATLAIYSPLCLSVCLSVCLLRFNIHRLPKIDNSANPFTFAFSSICFTLLFERNPFQWNSTNSLHFFDLLTEWISRGHLWEHLSRWRKEQGQTPSPCFPFALLTSQWFIPNLKDDLKDQVELGTHTHTHTHIHTQTV